MLHFVQLLAVMMLLQGLALAVTPIPALVDALQPSGKQGVQDAIVPTKAGQIGVNPVVSKVLSSSTSRQLDH